MMGSLFFHFETKGANYSFQLAQVSSGLDASSKGNWTHGGRHWQLCVAAPPQTPSLTFIFDPLKLPLHSQLTIMTFISPTTGTGNGSSALAMASISAQTALGQQHIAGPLPGSVALLTYTLPGSSKEPVAVLPTIHISAVLQEVGPAGSAAQSARNSTAAVKTDPSSNETVGDALGANNGTAPSSEGELAEAAAMEEGKAVLPTSASTTGDDSGSTVSDFLAPKINARSGLALNCLQNAECDPRFANATAATVMLMLASASGGRFCTGTFLRGPDPADQLIVTANHCRGDDDALTAANLWGVVLGHDANSCTPASPDTPASPPLAYPASAIPISSAVGGGARNSSYPITALGPSPVQSQGPRAGGQAMPVSPSQILQGLEIMWADETTDVLLLRLNNQVPEEFNPFMLGWDATGGDVAPSGSGTVHHDEGDVKKLTETTLPLRWVTWKAPYPTHLLATWTDGVTESGSSGATLMDVKTGLGLGVLTGGETPSSCSGGADMFGTLAAAWDAGLWQVLSPQGPDAVQTMQGAPLNRTGPGLIVTPAQLLLKEQADAKAALHIR